MEQNEQLMRERQDRESSTAGNTARDADQSSSQHNAQEQGWWWAWPRKKTVHISTWIGLLLLILALLVSLLLLDSVETTLVRVFFVISLLPFILVFGLIAVSLGRPLVRLLRARTRQNRRHSRRRDRQ